MTNTSSKKLTRKSLPAIIALTLTLASCSSGDDSEPVKTSTTTSSTALTTSSKAEPTSATSSSMASATAESEPGTSEPSTPEPATWQAPIDTAPAAPVVQQESIWNQPGVGYQCPGTDAFTNDPANCTAANLGRAPSYDQMYPGGYPASQVPYADGGNCPAAICGYGHDENGNPNPSSGELQTMDGCEAGYITDQDLCSRVFDKANQYGW